MSSGTAEVWTIKRAFHWTQGYLEKNGDSQSRISTEWLLGDACKLSRLEVYTQFDKPLTPEERAHLREAVRRRATGEPLQYIVGQVDFRHLSLEVRPGVLIPRPETEVLVDLALDALKEFMPQSQSQLQVLDLCTGSGCVGLSIAHECPNTSVVATDISSDAVALAQSNASKANLISRFTVEESDLFPRICSDTNDCNCQHYDLVVANPPYIPAAGMDELPSEVADFEPALALDGNDDGCTDGLAIARRIIEQALAYMKDNSQLILELDLRNVHAAAEFAVQLKEYKSVSVTCDLTGRDRFLIAVKRSDT